MKHEKLIEKITLEEKAAFSYADGKFMNRECRQFKKKDCLHSFAL